MLYSLFPSILYKLNKMFYPKYIWFISKLERSVHLLNVRYWNKWFSQRFNTVAVLVKIMYPIFYPKFVFNHWFLVTESMVYQNSTMRYCGYLNFPFCSSKIAFIVHGWITDFLLNNINTCLENIHSRIPFKDFSTAKKSVHISWKSNLYYSNMWVYDRFLYLFSSNLK